MEDRILLDAAGVTASLVELVDVHPVVQDLETAESTHAEPPTVDAPGIAPPGEVTSILRIAGDRLIFEDISDGQDNRLVISVDEGRLRVRDETGALMETSISGAIGSGTDDVAIPFSSLEAIDRFFIEVDGGHNFVTYDLSSDANSFVSRFEDVRLERSDSSDTSATTVVFVGDRNSDLSYQVNGPRVDEAVVVVTNGGGVTVFDVAYNNEVDVTGMRLAEFVADTGIRQPITVAKGTDVASQTHEALMVEFATSQRRSESIQFYDNETLALQGNSRDDIGLSIIVDSADNNHLNENLILSVGEPDNRDLGRIHIDGPVSLAGDMDVSAHQLDLHAAVHVQNDIRVNVSDNIVVTDPGSLTGRRVSLVSSGGRIISRTTTSTAIEGQQVDLTSAMGIGTRDQPVRTRADSLNLRVTDNGGVFIFESESSEIISASHVRGPIDVTANGSLIVRGDVSTLGDNPVNLATRHGDINTVGTIASDEGNIGLLSSGDITIDSVGRIETRSGTITLSPDADDSGSGRLSVDGLISNETGRTFLVVNDSASRVRGTIAGGGDVVKQGFGTLTVSPTGQFIHSRETLIEQGTLVVEGRITNSSRVTLADETTMKGGGDIAAPVFSNSPFARIEVTGSLRMGDGSNEGFDFAGTLIVHAGQTLTIRDSDLANLGQSTQLRDGGTILAQGGLEVGGGDQIIGSGRLDTHLVVRDSGRLSPGSPVGTLRIDDLTLQPGSTLELDINGIRPGTFDQLVVLGALNVDGSILQLRGGSFSPPAGAVLNVIQHLGSDSIQGRFIDHQGRTLDQGDTVRQGGFEARASYESGPQRNNFSLITDGPQFFVPMRLGGDTFLTLFIPGSAMIDVRPVSSEIPTQGRNDDVRITAEEFYQVRRAQELDADQDVRLFFRVYDDALQFELDEEYEIDQRYLGNLPSLFNEFRFPDGHYRVYLQEVGSQRVRLVLDVHIHEGKVVPENFREQERPFSQQPADDDDTTAPADGHRGDASQETSTANPLSKGGRLLAKWRRPDSAPPADDQPFVHRDVPDR